MPLQDMSRINAIVPNGCTPELQERNNHAIRNALAVIINNIEQIVNNNGLEIPIIGSGDTGNVVIPMQAKWAVSAGDDPANDPPTFIEPAAGNNWRGQIKAFPCADSAGNNIDTAHVWVVLPERLNVGIHLPKGAVFAYEETSSGELVAVSDYSAGDVTTIYWGVAQGDSADGAIDNVTVRRCDDALGNNPVLPNISVQLPERDGYTHQITTGDVLAFVEASDGTYVCVSDYTKNENEIFRFELTGALTPGGTANAETLAWNGAAYAKTGVAITVRDFQVPGRWRGASGYQGIAYIPEDRDASYEIIWMETIAEFASVTSTEYMGETDAGQMECNVNSYWNGNDPGATITIRDVSSLWSTCSQGMTLIVRYDWTNGYYVPVSCDNRFFYGKAQRNWNQSGGAWGEGYVSVRFLDTGIGGTEVGAAFNASFAMEQPTAGTRRRDPNVVGGDEIMLAVDQFNNVVVVDPGAWDDRIGMIKLWHDVYDDGADSLGKFDASKTYSGWGLMDAVHNSSANGGSGIDMQDFFPRGQVGTDACDNTENGTDRHSHTASLEESFTGIKVYDPDNSGDLSSDYPAHRDHRHLGGSHCGQCDLEQVSTPDASTYLIVSFADDHSDDFKWYSSGAVEMGAGGSHSSASDHAAITLRHAVNDPGHSHVGDINEALHLPPYKFLHFVERVRNSFETLGV